MPNIFAYFVLVLWPIICLVVFRRTSTLNAVIWTILGGYLILPVKVAIDFPLIPPLNKYSISALVAYLGCTYIKKETIKLLPENSAERLLIIVMMLIPIIHMFTNAEPVFNGETWVKGLRVHDIFSSLVSQYITLIPLIIGMQLVKTSEDQLLILKSLVLYSLWYSLLILFEIRMSPQLHTWVYGFFPHESFSQAFRDGGFRAMVFLGHGLQVALFLSLALAASIVLWKNKVKTYRFSPILIVLYLLLILLLSKTLGALIFGVFSIVALKYLPQTSTKRAVLFIAFVVILYPLLNINSLFPHHDLLELTASFDENRAQSLGFRFLHEERLIKHADKHFWFGWGGWGRNRLAGSVTDGYWVLVFGVSGFIGFLTQFGLFYLAIYKGVRSISNLKSAENNIMMGHVVIVMILMVDQLPNASMNSWSWFLVGTLLCKANCSSSKTPSDCRI